MSHYSSVEINLTDMAVIAESLEEMGFQTKTGRHEINGYGGRKETCDLSIAKNGKDLSIGWLQKGSKIEMVSDFWNTGLNQKSFMTELKGTYSKKTASTWMLSKGYSVSYANDEEGNLIVTGTKW